MKHKALILALCVSALLCIGLLILIMLPINSIYINLH